MTAKEYAEKYKSLSEPKIQDAEFVENVRYLFREMLNEMCVVIKARHISTLSGLANVKKEFNQKGNAISRLLGDVIKKDWFLILTNEIEKRGE